MHAIGALLLAALASCGPLMIRSDPTTFPVKTGAGAEMRGPQSVTLANAYQAPTQATIHAGTQNWMADLQQYTQTAMTLLDKEMAAQRIVNAPQAPKTITLRVRDVHSGPGFAVIRATLVLEAQYGDGTKSVIAAENASPATAFRAVDGALTLAVTRLLHDERFLDYVNR